MRTSLDALRSMVKYVALVLGDEWEVRMAFEEGEQAIPYARVDTVGPLVTAHAGSYYADLTRTFSVQCYPTSAQTVETAEQARFVAEQVSELLHEGFAMGVGLGAPLRVPLYDYAGVPLDGLAAFSDERHLSDYMRIVDSPSWEIMADPEDARETAVVATLRASWRRTTRSIPGTETLESVQVQHAPS